jgi:hypothetical protein
MTFVFFFYLFAQFNQSNKNRNKYLSEVIFIFLWYFFMANKKVKLVGAIDQGTSSSRFLVSFYSMKERI